MPRNVLLVVRLPEPDDMGVISPGQDAHVSKCRMGAEEIERPEDHILIERLRFPLLPGPISFPLI